MLTIAAIIAYANSFAGVMLFDDLQQITYNPLITSVVPISGHFKDSRPLVSLTFALNYAISGLSTWSYHAVNLAVHIAAGLALYGVVRRALVKTQRNADTIAFAAALIWIVHPLNTQAVTYLVQRSESMMTMFYLLTLYAVARSRESRSPFPWQSAAFVFCALGMLSKAVMVTAPLLAILYDRVFISTSWAAIRSRWRLYAGLAATWSLLLVTGVIQGLTGVGGVASHTVGFGVSAITPWQYALTQSRVIIRYFQLAFWPGDLCIDYGWTACQSASETGLPIAALILLLGVSVIVLRRSPTVGFWIAWVFITLAPTSSVVPIKDVIFEHRMYLPLAGLSVVVCLMASNLSTRMAIRRPIMVALLCVCAVALGTRTYLRNRDYHDEVAMWRRVALAQPTYARAHLGLGYALMMKGDLDDARAELERCLTLQPNWADAQTNLGLIEAARGRHEAAMSHHTTAIQLNPTLVSAHVNLAASLLAMNRTHDAIERLRTAIQLSPNNFDAHDRLAAALQQLGQFESALTECESALKLRPHSVDTIVRRANILADLGRYADAIPIYRTALSARPDSPEILSNLGTALRATNDLAGAEAAYKAALRVRPTYATALLNYGNLLRRQGRTTDAIDKYEAAVTAAPDNAVASLALGTLLYEQKQFERGLRACERAVQLSPTHVTAHYHVGLCHEALGQSDKAAAAYRACLTIQPAYEPALEKLRSLKLPNAPPDR